jgi:glyoxylase-like metal-dependent hydrolase (beta-lactamase superfamily II)
MSEIAPGIHRIEEDLGPRVMAQYVLVGDERTVLIDTGLASTPDEVLIPELEGEGLEPDLILISHADVDHCGGNRRMRERYPRALFACHEADRRWIESNAAMLAENYAWHAPHGLDQLDGSEMLALLGGDSPIDLGLGDGGSLRLGSGLRWELLHLPGHSPGHIGLWDESSRVAIIIDAVLSDGIYDRAGNRLIPPRYYDAAAYRSTIRRVRALEPELLLTAHFLPMDREAARAFCDRSLAFVDAVEGVVREQVAVGVTGLRELTAAVDARLGPYPEFTTEIAAGVRSHMAASA